MCQWAYATRCRTFWSCVIGGNNEMWCLWAYMGFVICLIRMMMAEHLSSCFNLVLLRRYLFFKLFFFCFILDDFCMFEGGYLNEGRKKLFASCISLYCTLGPCFIAWNIILIDSMVNLAGGLGPCVWKHWVWFMESNASTVTLLFIWEVIREKSKDVLLRKIEIFWLISG